MMKTVDIEDILVFHNKLIERTGGSNGIRDIGLIESALNMANATFDVKDLYESILHKVAVIIASLIKNHGFVDGNKRIGIAVMLLLLKLNSINILCVQKELIELGLGIASNRVDNKAIKEWVIKHMENKT